MNLCNAEAHLTLKLVGHWLCSAPIDRVTNRATTVKFAASPARLSALICHQARLTDRLRRDELIVYEDD